MKLQVRAFQIKESDTFDLESTVTVAQLKERVQLQFSIPIEKQKIIYSGKQLKDNQTLEEAGVKDNDSVIVVGTKSPTVSKSTAAVPATPANAAGATQSTPSAPIASRAVQEIEPQTPSPAARTAQPAAEGTAESMEPEGDLTINPEDTFLTGDKYEIAISNLMEMGYSREMCVKAMRAGFNNPNQAAEYLLTGIPEGADMPHSSEGAGDEGIQQQQQQQQQASPGDGLEILRGSEEFQNLRRMVQSNPQLLQDVLQQLEQSNPEVARRINENREEFLQMLLEGAEIEGEGDDAMQPQFIRITQEEKEAIDRLTELGFERDLVIQAYFACDKNEEMTANYLFNHGHED